jgi:hypothetical protein
MGQEQSLGASSAAVDPTEHEGFRVVQSAAASGVGDLADEPLVRAVNALPLPYPVLPPSPVRDDVTSALSGAQMMHGLRAAFGSMGSMGSLLPGAAAAVAARPAAGATACGSEASVGADAAAQDGGDTDSGGSSVEGDADASAGAAAAEAQAAGRSAAGDVAGGVARARAAQERRARTVMDVDAVGSVVTGAGGGAALAAVLDEQARLAAAVIAARASAERVAAAMDATEKEAVRTRRALQRLERLRMAAADVQDGLEAGVATANILGASHFAADDELRSFKDYLRHHPPDYVD